jgi:hypothetical protein
VQISKIISGGQIGADRAALDFAIEYDIPHGGWIPKGRRTEDGPLADKYQLRERPDKSYSKRTEQNILYSDGTLIISHGRLSGSGGSVLTRRLAKKHNRPWIHVDMDEISLQDAADKIRKWFKDNNISVLNVAGPRASKDPRIYQTVLKVLKATIIGL